MPQINPKRSVVAINNDAGVFTVIRLTTWAKYVEINEDPSQNGGQRQGLQYQALDPFAPSTNITQNAGPVLQAGGDTPEISFGDRYHVNDLAIAPLGNPGSGGNTDVPGDERAFLGTPLVQLRTNSVNPTNVIVLEYA